MGTIDVGPIEREGTPSIIARTLRDAIMSGELRPGSRCGETELAARFGVSRGPLREAMQRLVSEGLLRNEPPRRGLFVTELGPDEIYDVYVGRTAVEQAAAVRILKGGDQALAVASLDGAIATMQSAARQRDWSELSRADLKFHETFVRESGSPRLMRMINVLLVETRLCLGALRHTDQCVEDRVAEHVAIRDALREGAEDQLLDVIERHMEDAVSRLVPGSSIR